MILWLKRLLLGTKPVSLADNIVIKYTQHPMLSRSNQYLQNPNYWIHYYKEASKKSELRNFAEILDDYCYQTGLRLNGNF